MIVECLVIFAILFAIIILFLRTNKDYAIETTPLLILPGANILVYLFSKAIFNMIPINNFIVYVIFDIIAAIVSSVFIVICSRRFKTKSNKITYVSMCIIFNVVLASIIIGNLYRFYF